MDKFVNSVSYCNIHILHTLLLIMYQMTVNFNGIPSSVLTVGGFTSPPFDDEDAADARYVCLVSLLPSLL